jgi:DNA primase
MTILTLLQEILGNYIQQKDEYLFACPFCHSGHKKKLSVNISNNKWKCWICGSKGGHIIWLLKKLNVSKDLLAKFKQELSETDIKEFKSTTAEVTLRLPSEYKPLWKVEKSHPYYHAIKYLKNRGITSDDILRYRIGFCTEGPYANRIILPSYDRNNHLNYFTARLFYNDGMKYKNPPVSKNVICFENMVAWDAPIILCEGMFDAITLRRNAIPLLGKTLPKTLEQALLQNKTRQVIIFLDEDARIEALKLEQHLRQYDIDVSMVLTRGKDASEMGFETAWEEIHGARKTSFKELIEQQLMTI